MDAGELRERIELLELQETETGWAWAAYARTWAKVTLTGKNNLFSTAGRGAGDAEILLRDRTLTLGQAMRWRGRHLLLTEITQETPGLLRIKAAAVETAECTALFSTSEGEAERCFPAVVTEKYVTHTQDEPMAYNVLRHVLVTPKAVTLRAGRIAEVKDAVSGETEKWWVKVPHELAPWKNEYEIERVIEN